MQSNEMMQAVQREPLLSPAECEQFAALFQQATGMRLDIPTAADLSLQAEWRAIIRRAIAPQTTQSRFGPGEMRPLPQPVARPAAPSSEYATAMAKPMPRQGPLNLD